MFTVTRTSTTPAGALDVRVNVTHQEQREAGVLSERTETICRSFEPGDVHTLDDTVVERMAADPGLAAHFTFEPIEPRAERPRRARSTVE